MLLKKLTGSTPCACLLLWLGYSKLVAQVPPTIWHTGPRASSRSLWPFQAPCTDRTLPHNIIHGTHCRWTPVEVDPTAWPLHHIPLLHDSSPQQRDTKSSKRPRSFTESYTKFKTYRNYLQKGFCVSVLPSSSPKNVTRTG